MDLGPYTLRMAELRETDNPNYSSQLAAMEVYRGGQLVGELNPERRFYKASQQATTEVAIRPRLNEDLYIVFSGMTEQNRAVISAHLNPLVNWIWIGTLVLVFGTLICLIPSQPGAGKTQRVSGASLASAEGPKEVKEVDEVLARTVT